MVLVCLGFLRSQEESKMSRGFTNIMLLSLYTKMFQTGLYSAKHIYNLKTFEAFLNWYRASASDDNGMDSYDRSPYLAFVQNIVLQSIVF